MLTKNRYYQNTEIFKVDDIGKTMKQLGFGFAPAKRIVPVKKQKEVIPERRSQFKGYYHTPFGIFASAHAVNQEKGYRIHNWCKNTITVRQQMVSKWPDVFAKSDIGKTTTELGFYFEPVRKKSIR